MIAPAAACTCDAHKPGHVHADTCPLGPCPEPTCDGDTHYTGRRDPFTNEDIEAGPCPRFM